jgi:hypothetical protein
MAKKKQLVLNAFMGASADDPFSVGLLKVKDRFWNDWEKQLDEIIAMWKEELGHVHSKTAFSGALADTLRFDPFDHPDLREGFPPKLKRICRGRRDYSKLLKLLDSMLLQDCFKRWLSGVRDLIRRNFQDVFEISAANSDRTRRDPEEFAIEFLSELIEEDDGLISSDAFLCCFFKERFARVGPATALLRELLLEDLCIYLCELRSSAQIELAKRGWKKPKSLGLLLPFLRIRPIRPALLLLLRRPKPMLRLLHLPTASR